MFFTNVFCIKVKIREYVVKKIKNSYNKIMGNIFYKTLKIE